ncbi:hypothetical protein Tco_0499028 [Tanacetum coccineum]
MSKNDMKDRIYALSKNDLKDLVKTYHIPLDLHPRLPDPGFTMDLLPADAIGIYFEFLRFFGVCVPFSTFLLSVLKYFKVYISQLVPLGLNKVVSFEVVCRDLNIVPTITLFYHSAIPDHLTWRHSCSCVSDDLPSDSYDRNDVQRLCAHLIRLRDMREEVLVRSGLSSVWFNEECDPIFRRMSIYDFMTLPSWSDAKISEESHHLSLPLLERAMSHSTTLATKGAIIPLPTTDEIVASPPDSPGSSAPELDQAKGTDETDRADSLPRLRIAGRDVVWSAAEPAHVWGLPTHASTSGRSLSLGVLLLVVSWEVGAEVMQSSQRILDCLARSALSCNLKNDQIPEDDFGKAHAWRTIELDTIDPLAPGPYHMPYPYEGFGSDYYTTELRRTESLLPLELSNRVNVLSALLVSHGYELNSRYANLVSSKAYLQEKFDKKKGDVKLLRSEVTSLDSKLENLQRGYDALGQENRELQELTQTNAKLSEQALTVRDLQNELVLEKSKSQEYKDVAGGLKEEVTQFVSSGVESLVRKLLSSDEFHAALDRVASLGINYGVERGLRMGHTDVEFEAAVQKVSTSIKIVAASEGSLSDVDQILLDKFVRSVTSVAAAPFSANEAPK